MTFKVLYYVNPVTIVNCAVYSWKKIGGIFIQKKEIQCLSTETACIAFHVYNYIHPKILKAEFVEILKTSKSILDFGIDALDPSMELFNEDVPDINFRRAVPKLPGMDTSTLKCYTQEMNEGRRTMQLDVDTEKMDQLEKLVDCIK